MACAWGCAPTSGGVVVSGLYAAFKRRRARRALARRLDGDPVSVAKILLLFRMMLVEGVVRDRELALFRRICRDHFGIAESDMDALHVYLERRQARGDAAEQEQSLRRMTQEERRQLIGLMGQLAASAESDPGPAATLKATGDRRFLRDTAAALGLAGSTE